jgi:hypothetical protein
MKQAIKNFFTIYGLHYVLAYLLGPEKQFKDALDLYYDVNKYPKFRFLMRHWNSILLKRQQLYRRKLAIQQLLYKGFKPTFYWRGTDGGSIFRKWRNEKTKQTAWLSVDVLSLDSKGSQLLFGFEKDEKVFRSKLVFFFDK